MADSGSIQVECDADEVGRALREALNENAEGASKLALTHLSVAVGAAETLAKRIGTGTMLVGASVQISDDDEQGFAPAQIAISASRVNPEVLREREEAARQAEEAAQAAAEEEARPGPHDPPPEAEAD